MSHGGVIRPYQSAFATGLKALDVGTVWFSLVVSAYLYGLNWDYLYGMAATFGMVVFYLAANQFSIYDSWRGRLIRHEVLQIAKCWLALIFVFLLGAFITKTSTHFSRQVLLQWWVIGLCMHFLTRLSLRISLLHLRSTGRNTRTAVVVGHGLTGVKFAARIASQPWTGIKVVGVYDDILPKSAVPDIESALTVLGPLKDLYEDVHKHNYDMVFITLPGKEQHKAKLLVDQLRDCAAEVHIVPDIFTYNLLNAKVREIGGVPVISVYDSPLDGVGQLVKRLEDVVLGTLLLTISAVPMLLIALAVKLDSPGPALFKQRRFGQTGREIEVWKFRTMRVCENGANITQATKGDTRITRIGAFLRRTSLDELPQFFNVLRGDMSIVGPRPHAVAHNEFYRVEISGYMQRHLVKPGITGWAQINGWRGETDTKEKMEKRVEHDMHYIQSWSLWLDIKIIFLTVLNGFLHKNAY